MDDLQFDARPDLFDNIGDNGIPAVQPETPAVPHTPPENRRGIPVPVTPAPHPAAPLGEDTRLAGLYLKELREFRHLTLAQVSDETRIKPIYLEQLENNQLEKQHPVYTMAYLKKLVRLYQADIEDFSGIVSLLRNQLPYEPPADIGKSVVEHEADEEEQKKLHQLALLLSGVAAAIVLAIVVSVILLLVNLRSGGSETRNAITLDESRLLEMQEQPALGITPLPRRTP